jgi:hypothetical protein
MEDITVDQVRNASPEELQRLNKILYKRAIRRIGGFVLIKVAIYWFIHQSAKKYWSAS